MIEFNPDKNDNYQIPSAPVLSEQLREFLNLFADSIDGETISLIGQLIAKFDAMTTEEDKPKKTRKMTRREYEESKGL